jgi:hypothetical protein
MVWDIKQPQGKMVGPHIKALLFFPWFKRLCNQHYYETVDDKVNKTMKRIYGDNWTDYLEDKNWRD